MNPLILTLLLALAVLPACKEEKKKEIQFNHFNCVDATFRAKEPKLCAEHNRLFSVSKEEQNLMDKLSK